MISLVGQGGDFAAGTGPVHYGSAPLPIPPGYDLLVVSLLTTTDASFTLTGRGSGTTWARTVQGEGREVFHGAYISAVKSDTASVSILWELAPQGAFSTEGANGQVRALQAGSWAVASQAAAGVATPTDNQSFSGSIAGSTADAVSQAGAVTLPVGSLVRYRLAASGGLITASDPLTYVRLVGATSGVIYAAAYVTSGGTGNPMGEIRMPTAEKLDIHTANADSVAHVFTASWESFPLE